MNHSNGNFLEVLFGYPAGAPARVIGPSVVFLVFAAALWSLIAARMLRARRRCAAFIAGGVGPAAACFAMMTWLYCYFSQCMPGDEERRASIIDRKSVV